jgi:hypothetical protein
MEAPGWLLDPDNRRYGCPAMDGLYKGTDGGLRVAVFICSAVPFIHYLLKLLSGSHPGYLSLPWNIAHSVTYMPR